MNSRNKTNVEIKNLDIEALLWILDNTFGNIYVTDKDGNILFVNENSLKAFGLKREEVINKNTQELIDNKIITRSTTLDAIKTKDTVIGSLKTREGYELFGISRPMYDDQGNISIIMTYSQERETMHTFSDAIDKEKQISENYKNVIAYYSGIGNQSKSIIATSKKMQEIMSELNMVAKTSSTILLYGESGTGKDVIANFIHAKSLRNNEPFIPVNCAAIPQELMESEFFGYAKGAFTGANSGGKPGFFEMANKGTIFLDEIGELPLSLQSKLLRVIETGDLMRIGSNKVINADVRIIAATNRDLKKMVQEKKFREDLYYRLIVIPVKLPPLRERKEDITPIANSFLDEYNRKYNFKRRLSDEIIDAFNRYSWPGNIREMRNIIERLVITSKNNLLTLSDFNSQNATLQEINTVDYEYQNIPKTEVTLNNNKELKELSIQEAYENELYEMVLKTLLKTNGNKTKTANILGISRGKLYRILNNKHPMA